MIHNRINGILHIHSITILLILPLSFILFSLFAQNYLHIVSLSQINFPAYLLGIFIAALLYFETNKNLVSIIDRYYITKILKHTNRQILILSIVILAIIFSIKDHTISRLFLVEYIALSWFLLFIINLNVNKVLPALLFKSSNLRRSLVIGNNDDASYLINWLKNKNYMGIDLIGLISIDEQPNSTKKTSQLKNLGTIEKLNAVIQDKQINQIILANNSTNLSDIYKIKDIAIENGCRFYIYNFWEKYFNQPIKIVGDGNMSFLTFQDEPLENPANRFLKSSMDFLISLPVVLFMIPVLCVIIKVAQCIQSKGPLFIKQKRSGFNGEIFYMYKFRTMHLSDNKELENKQATKDDDRIYSFGKFLRKTSLDEFPQFINVLLGNMSLVGPRPHLLKHDKDFHESVKVYKLRYFSKPGITGLSQVNGYRGQIKILEDLSKRISLDIEYIQNWSIELDIVIILKTFLQIFSPKRTAY